MFIETSERFSQSSRLVLALSRFIMTYESINESHRLVKALIPTTLRLQLRQMYSYVGGYLLTELGLLAQYVIGLAGQFQNKCSKRSYMEQLFICPIPNSRALFALGCLLFKVSSAFEFSSPGIRTSSMLVI